MEPFKMHIVTLEGQPRQRGRIHGEMLKQQIREIREKHEQGFRMESKITLDEFCEGFISNTRLFAAAERWTPDLVEEVRGVSEAAGVGFNYMLTFQLQDESIWYSLERRMNEDSAGSDHCSGLGLATGKHRTIVAQNLDTPVLYNGYQTLLHIKYPASSMESYVITEPGLVGICGLNSHAVGVCQNTLANQLNHSVDGLGAMFVARGLIDHGSLPEALDFLHTIKHASGENYIVGNPDMVVDFECSANQVCQLPPDPGSMRVIHTNHPLINQDRADPIAILPDIQRSVDLGMQNSSTRYHSLEKQIFTRDDSVSVDAVKAILSSHESDEFPICRHKPSKPGSMTNNSIIMVLSDDPELHISSGPPCTDEYRTFKF